MNNIPTLKAVPKWVDMLPSQSIIPKILVGTKLDLIEMDLNNSQLIQEYINTHGFRKFFTVSMQFKTGREIPKLIFGVEALFEEIFSTICCFYPNKVMSVSEQHLH
ncbi:MAG: hypothetical protein ACFFC7_28145 [Candidatus Hermodarchaeota archaeon]